MKFTSCNCRRKERGHGEGLSVPLTGLCSAKGELCISAGRNKRELQSKLLQNLS